MKYFECMHSKHKHMDCNHKIWGHHATKIGITYSNGGHIGFNYTHTSLKACKALTITMSLSQKVSRSARLAASISVLFCSTNGSRTSTDSSTNQSISYYFILITCIQYLGKTRIDTWFNFKELCGLIIFKYVIWNN